MCLHVFGQVLRTNTSAPCRIPNLLVEITSPWRALEGVNSCWDCVRGHSSSCGVGLGRVETEDEGPLTVGLAVLQVKYDVHGKGLVNRGQRPKPWNGVLLEGGAPGIFSVA